MKSAPLSESLEIAPSQLFVADIAAMKQYYHELVGLEVLASTRTTVTLGYNHIPVIELVSKPKLAHAGPRTAGLFHNAVLFDSRGELSRAVASVLTKSQHTYSGTGDHLVSEAFYFTDPEGNGLELYYDRPREQWTWENGQIKMDTLYIDPVEYVYRHIGEKAETDKKLGHVHLRAGNITEARKFYIDLLGFTLTLMAPGALFMSVAGYHHHIAVNTWMSEGAGKRLPALGLSEVAISLASDDDVSALAARLEAAGWPFDHKNGTVYVADPWGNKLVFSS